MALNGPELPIVDPTGGSVALADPGNAGVISGVISGTMNLVSGGSGETRTLAVPNHVGQRLTLHMDTDGGGNIVITATSGLSNTDTTITFANAGEVIHLIAVTLGTENRWAPVLGDLAPALS